MGKKRDRPEIEITPEMIAAGKKALQDWHDAHEWWEDGAVSVFRAMVRVAPWRHGRHKCSARGPAS